MLAYANSFKDVFVYDDAKWVVAVAPKRAEHPIINSLKARRPLVDLSLALNYHLDKLNPWGYHLFNLAVHLLAGLTLFGVIRRTLLLAPNGSARPRNKPTNRARPNRSPKPNRKAAAKPARAERKDASADRQRLLGPQSACWFAFAVALIWIVHPLQTQCVTYVIQRGESMMGLFYLLTLYCVIRSATTTRSALIVLWSLAAVLACISGMASKAVMVTAPIVILLYDRIFLTRSFAATLRRRWWLYISLAATWGVLILVGVARGVLNAHPTGTATVGFGYKAITPWQYALTEPGVILRYIRLSFWPTGQVLDYGSGGDGWAVAKSIGQAALPLAVVVALLLITIVALFKRPRLGFVALWFFAILAPTSSFIPIKDPIYEHRMYLSLAAVIVLALAAAWWLAGRLTRPRRAPRAGNRPPLQNVRRTNSLCVASSVAIAVVLTVATHQRNKVYASKIAMWKNIVQTRPENPRGHNNLGKHLLDIAKKDPARLPDAIKELRAAVTLKEDFLAAQYNLGNALARARQYDEAIRCYDKALSLKPDFIDAHIMRGNALTDANRLQEAETAFRNALKTAPPKTSPILIGRAHFNLGNTLFRLGRLDEARQEYRQAIAIDHRHFKAWYGVGSTLFQEGKYKEAIAAFQKALKINPNHPESRQAIKRCRSALQASKR